ncbi:MAG: phosphatase PAP2 family protein [Rickettsiales bacterium]|jgi:membrane-associated phospholipid phosphatase|nr:phosphatase PAP2 family protein [Rickettsiales bacterium]
MFLRKNNTLKWKWIIFAAALTIVLCLSGIFWFDKPLLLFFRQFDLFGWHAIDVVFAAKIWLVASGVIALVIFIKNALKSKNKSEEDTIKFNIKKIIANFLEKSKGNYSFLIFCSVFFADLATAALKFGFGRQRPIFFEALGQTGFYPLTSEWAFNSMPSGHAAASFAGLVMIGMLFPRIKWATWTIAIIVGASRIAYGAHWPSDIILGAFVGMLSADIAKSFFFADRNN